MKLSLRSKLYVLIMPLVTLSLFMLLATVSPLKGIRQHLKHFRSSVTHFLAVERFAIFHNRLMKEYPDVILTGGGEKHSLDLDKCTIQTREALTFWKKIADITGAHDMRDTYQTEDRSVLESIEKGYGELTLRGREIVAMVAEKREDRARELFLKTIPHIDSVLSFGLEQEILRDEEELKEDTYHLAGLINSFRIFSSAELSTNVKAMQKNILHAIMAENFSVLFSSQIKQYSILALGSDRETEQKIRELQNRTMKLLAVWKQEISAEGPAGMESRSRKEMEIVHEVEKDVLHMNEIGKVLVDLVGQGRRLEAVNLIDRDLEFLINFTLPKVDKIVRDEELRLTENMSHIEKSLGRAMFGIGVLGLFVFAVGVGSPWLLTRTIINPIMEIKNAAERIGSGDLETQIQVQTGDELGDLASSFNRMVTSLSETTVSKDKLERHNHEMLLLRDMGDMLQVSNSIEEACIIVSQSAAKLFPESPGALCLIGKSRNIVEVVATWGEVALSESVFPPDHCWALRTGHVHLENDLSGGHLCSHLGRPLPAASLCVPMMAQGEAMGMLHLQVPAARQAEDTGAVPIEDKKRLTQTVADHVALAFANIRLREKLHAQSIRDPLTGLFNRRYMEESLERELRRAERSGGPVGVVMIDIDHFKRFNDTFGHEAGDAVLRELGAFLHSFIREEDIACRFGGEEFVFIMPGADIGIARQRAELMRESAGLLKVEHAGRPLGPISLSMGVSVYPVHGATAEAALKAADSALYRAKAEGRNRVVTA